MHMQTSFVKRPTLGLSAVQDECPNGNETSWANWFFGGDLFVE
jgi:hypothetical protein